MAGNSIGEIFKLTTFGESHGEAIGGVIDGCPAGLKIDFDFIRIEMQRRRPGFSDVNSPRKESDEVEFISGIFEGKSTGTPIGFVIRNNNQISKDYSHLKETYRPSHADFTYERKYGFRDHRGGGRSSARETACRVVGGAIAKLILKANNIQVTGFVSQIGEIKLTETPQKLSTLNIESSPLRCPDNKLAAKMERLIKETKDGGDTLGGTVTCIIQNAPAGLGEPVFDKVEAELAKAILSINAVKGFEIGSGFNAPNMKGSEHNDIFEQEGDRIKTITNFSGGVQGGITNGMDIVFKVAFKPVATLMRDQKSINKSGDQTVIKGKGRHDVCVVPRAVPIVEAMAAITLADLLLRNRSAKITG